ncbi:MAG TPA: hypothetical protein DCK95_08030 [Anaerolineaceae bacterium]|nr:hypothetical protein [Anaerolineaceae bacterium]
MKIKDFFSSLVIKTNNFVKQNRKKTILIGVGILAIILLSVFVFGGSNDNETTQTAVVSLTTGDFSKTIDVVGNVKAVPSATITWGTSGTVGEINYQIGDSVTSGDVIAKLADNSISASILEAQTSLLEARYNLELVKTSNADFQNAAQALEDAEYDYRKKEDDRDYWNFNGTTQKTLDEARQLYHELDNQVWDLQNQYDALSTDDPNAETVNGELQEAIFNRDKALRNLNYLLGHAYDHSVETDYIEYEIAKADLQEARINYQRYMDNSEEIAAAQAKVQALENTVNSASIIAPFDGVITNIFMNKGETVTSGSEAIQLDNLNNLVIEISVSEVDVKDIHIGQDVVITFDAIPNKEYQGKVANISQSGNDSSGIVEFRVSNTVTNPDDQIKPGFTAIASILIQNTQNAVLVPNLAIQSINGESVVMVVDEEGKVTPLPVEIESSNESFSILKGSPLSEGDKVALEITPETYSLMDMRGTMMNSGNLFGN